MENKRTAYIALACVCFFWGTTYFFIREGVKHIPPFLFAGIRHFMAGVLFTFYFIVLKKEKLPNRAILLRLFFIGLLLLFFANSFVTWAEVYIPSGLTSLLCCFMPFYMLVFNLLSKKSEAIHKTSLLGLSLGLVGSVLIFSDNIVLLAQPAYTLGIILTIVANIAWALGTIYTKRNPFSIAPLFSAGLQMLMVGGLVLVFSFIFEDYSSLQFTTNGILSIVYLVVFGSAVGFGCYFYAVSRLPITLVSINSYANVVVAMALAALFQSEVFGIKTIISLFITLVGIYLVNVGVMKSKK